MGIQPWNIDKNRNLTINHGNLSIICRAWTWLKHGIWGFNYHVWDDITWYHKKWISASFVDVYRGFSQQVVSILDTNSSKFSHRGSENRVIPSQLTWTLPNRGYIPLKKNRGSQSLCLILCDNQTAKNATWMQQAPVTGAWSHKIFSSSDLGRWWRASAAGLEMTSWVSGSRMTMGTHQWFSDVFRCFKWAFMVLLRVFSMFYSWYDFMKWSGMKFHETYRTPARGQEARPSYKDIHISWW